MNIGLNPSFTSQTNINKNKNVAFSGSLKVDRLFNPMNVGFAMGATSRLEGLAKKYCGKGDVFILAPNNNPQLPASITYKPSATTLGMKEVTQYLYKHIPEVRNEDIVIAFMDSSHHQWLQNNKL